MYIDKIVPPLLITSVLIALTLTSMPLAALIVEWPVAADGFNGWGDVPRVYVKWVTLDVHEWDNDPTLQEAFPILKSYNTMSFGVAVKSHQVPIWLPPSTYGSFPTSIRVSELVKYKDMLPDGWVRVSGLVESNVAIPCMGVALASQTSHMVNMPPGVECITPPPTVESCAMTTPIISINFGTVDITKAAGTSKTSSLAVECTGSVNYIVRSIGPADILLSNGMSTTLKVGGKDLGSTLSGSKGMNTLNVEATLKGTPTISGPFTGSSVLVVSYP